MKNDVLITEVQAELNSGYVDNFHGINEYIVERLPEMLDNMEDAIKDEDLDTFMHWYYQFFGVAEIARQSTGISSDWLSYTISRAVSLRRPIEKRTLETTPDADAVNELETSLNEVQEKYEAEKIKVLDKESIIAGYENIKIENDQLKETLEKIRDNVEEVMFESIEDMRDALKHKQDNQFYMNLHYFRSMTVLNGKVHLLDDNYVRNLNNIACNLLSRMHQQGRYYNIVNPEPETIQDQQ